MPTQVRKGRLKNATSSSPNTFRDIEKVLVSHEAREIVKEYAPSTERVAALRFTIEVQGQRLSFRLPARVAAVERTLYGSNAAWLTTAQREQAYRTAWANIRDWLSAQMAMLDTGMVAAEEVFLPYLLTPAGDQTLYEHLRDQRFTGPALPPAAQD